MKHIVGLSGGIDSQAVARWVRNRYPAEDAILLRSNAGANESPITDAFIDEYSAKVFPVTCIEPRIMDAWGTKGFAESSRGLDSADLLTFEGLAKIKGRFPSRMMPFCTEKLKLVPSRRWTDENLPDGDYVRYSGVRRDESETRKDTPFSWFDKFFDCEVICPIVDWTKQMCFDYVDQYSEPINPLYSLGFDRVGCFLCVNSKKDQIRKWAERFPEEISKVRGMEERVGATYFAPCVPGMLINWIDDVVAWSKTDRGGRQFNILTGLETPSCESKYGLCE